MDIFSRIAEQRIKEALVAGDFDNLEGMGRPLIFDDETWIPDDLRIAYRFLKNAGCIPPELELRNQIVTLRQLLGTIDDNEERLRKIRELNFKLLKLAEMRKRPLDLNEFPEYEEKIYTKITE